MVTMKGGTSGNREDALPNVSVPFNLAKPQDTATNGGVSPMVGIKSEKFSSNRDIKETPDFMPTGGAPDDTAV